MTVQETSIEWATHTVNFWEGCQKVGPGCDHCYAEARDVRFTGGQHWGPGAPRRKVKGGIAKLRKINKGAIAFADQHGHRPRVFCSSLSDVFDNAVDPDWQAEAFEEIFKASDIHVLMLTKRIGNVEKMIPAAWHKFAWPQHVGLMITVVNQAEADRDIPKLLDLKKRYGIPWVGLSVEPMLGRVDIRRCLYEMLDYKAAGLGDDPMAAGMLCDAIKQGTASGPMTAKIDWVICGGESGRNARPIHPRWAISLRDQCRAAGTAFLFKQWGEWCPAEYSGGGRDKFRFDDGQRMNLVGKKIAGRRLEGAEHNEMPEGLER